MYEDLENWLKSQYNYSLTEFYNMYGELADIFVNELEKDGLIEADNEADINSLHTRIDDFIRDNDFGIARRKSFLRKLGM